MTPLSGRVALVTGGGSGIGRATCALLAEQGAAVVVLDRRGASEVVTEITTAGGRAVAFEGDVTDAADMHRAVELAHAEFGRIGIVVNCAGVGDGSTIGSDNLLDDWDRALSVNLTGSMLAIRACLPDLLDDGAARVVNVASTDGLGAARNGMAYSVSKHGVVGLTRSLAVQLARRGVTANCVCPGATLTGLTEQIPEDARAEFARRSPMGRYARPAEIAHMIAALAAPGASFVNGAIIPVDGGLTARTR